MYRNVATTSVNAPKGQFERTLPQHRPSRHHRNLGRFAPLPCRQTISRAIRRRIPTSPRSHHANRLQRRRRFLKHLRRSRQNTTR